MCLLFVFFFFYLSGDMWPWLDLYQLKIKPVIGLTKPAWPTGSIRNLDDPVKFNPWRLFLFFMNQPRNKQTETLNPPHPNFQLEMKTKHVSIFYLLCMIRPMKTEIIALSIKKKKNHQLSSLLYIKIMTSLSSSFKIKSFIQLLKTIFFYVISLLLSY